MSVLTLPALLSAEEFARLPENGVARELVRGQIVDVPMPNFKHGYICMNIGGILREWVKSTSMGRVMSNDSFVRTQRGPDTVRGADICYVSYVLLPAGQLPDGLLDVVPELIFEVRSPSDRWNKLVAKATEYIEAGVRVVAIVDPKDLSISIFRPDEKAVLLKEEDAFTVPDLLPGFSVPLPQFFE